MSGGGGVGAGTWGSAAAGAIGAPAGDRAVSPAFGARVMAAIQARGRVMLGIDPHPGLVAAWGLEDSPAGLWEFAKRSVEAAAGVAMGVKPSRLCSSATAPTASPS